MKFILAKPAESSFIREDEKILASLGALDSIPLKQNMGAIPYLLGMLQMAFKILVCRKDTKVLIWFADYHAAVAVVVCRLRNLKSYLFVGGYDAICYPELKMGVFCRPWRAICARFALKHTGHIIANHESLLKSSNYYYSAQGHPDGVRSFIPELKTPCSVVYNSVSFTESPNLDRIRKQQVLCVGVTPRLQDFVNKGYDLLIEVCRAMPQTQFIFVGIKSCWKDELEVTYRLSEPSNLKIISWLEQNDLHRLMEETAVYVQASISEGMPNALMEAMYYGCFPVGSNVAGIPTVMGEYGIVVKHRSVAELKTAITLALEQTIDRCAVSKSVSQRLSPQIRAQRITEILNDEKD